MAKTRNPLEPMSTTAKALVTFLALLLGAGLLGMLFADNVSVLGIGDASVCVTDTTASAGGGEETASGFKAAPGADLILDAHPKYCAQDAGMALNMLDTASRLVPLTFTIGALLLVLRLIKGAEREGLYTAQTAGRLRGLGWWLLVGSVLSAILTSVADQAMVASLSADSDAQALAGLFVWDVPFMAICTGLGILSFARIMQIGCTMREELEGTV
ncbi:DUF2975 domain-containing protein [Streptomyces sp. NPDC050439]|uniref:DUF2975 domain-containing protein n=1 Tax=unclassified Streptomyces TaxID=2593676 RepID=UPI00342D7AF3